MMMRFFAALLLFYHATAVPEGWDAGMWWPGEFGMPCTSKTDRRELAGADGGCEEPVLTEPRWRKKKKT